MLVVPSDNNPFKWSEIHSLAKAKLEALDQAIREEVQARLEPLPANGGARHQFFVLLSERADDWATRAKTAYLECLTQIGREPSQSINHSIWENGLKFFITENLRGYMILACGITAQELKWAEGSPRVRSTPQVKAVLFTLHDINRIVQKVLGRFQSSMNRSDSWLAETWSLLTTLPPSEREDSRFVAGRAPATQVRGDRGPEQFSLHVSAETDVASDEGILPQSAVDSLWQQFSSDFAKLAAEERIANALPIGVMAHPESNRSSDLADWGIHNGGSENFKARFGLLASQVGNALSPLPVGASPFCYWLHRLYQDLRENRSSLGRFFIGSGWEAPLIDNVCEASSTFCLRLQQRVLENAQQKELLATCFQDWIESNLVEVSVPGQVSDRNRVSLVAKSARVSIPIEFLSSRLQETRLPCEGLATCSPRDFFNAVAEAHGLVWVITPRGLWMAQQPPSTGAYIDASGTRHREVHVEQADATPASVPEPASAKTQRQAALLNRVKGAPVGTTFRYADAAVIFEVSEKTIRNWLEEGKLEKGTKRSTITAESIKRSLGFVT